MQAQRTQAAEQVSKALEKLKSAQNEVAELAQALASEPARGSFRTLRFRVRVAVTGQPEPLFLKISARWTSGRVTVGAPARARVVGVTSEAVHVFPFSAVNWGSLA